MMLRKLLTLLAVFTGLTTAVAPAQALESSVQAVQMTQDAAACQAQGGVISEVQQDIFGYRSEDEAGMCMRPVIVIHTPTVMLQADRARE
jgi:hypothetical protein